MKKNISNLRIIGMAEGISFLLLLGICMPLKYVMEIPQPTTYVGMAHGVLFILYCLYVMIVAYQLKWGYTLVFWSLFAAIVPFGPFAADRKIFRIQAKLNHC